MREQFWLLNPKILFDKNYITNIWPKENDTIEQKLNAITRIVILLTILGYIATKSKKLLITSFITIIVIIIIYKTRTPKKITIPKKTLQEGFTSPLLYKALKKDFTSPVKDNPLMNVMLPEINSNPTRKEAAPSFNPAVEKEINDSVKKNIDPRLFQDLGDTIEFETSMRNFYTTANTQVPNDQKAFAEFCYGGMKSCKEDYLQCDKNNYRYTNP